MADPGDAPSILLDVSRLVWRRWGGQIPTGIDRACLAYVSHYRNRANAVVQWGKTTWVLSKGASRRLFRVLLEGDRAGNRAALLRVFSFILVPPPPLSVKGRLYLNIGHTGLNSAAHRQWVGRSGVRPIYFLHDLIPITHPQYCREGEGDRHRSRIEVMLELGAAIMVNSEDTLQRFREYLAESGRTAPDCLIIPPGLDPCWEAAMAETPDAAPRDPAYFVTIGTIEARKNHMLLLQLWRRLAERLGEDCPRLVIVGQRGWRNEAVFDLLDNCPTIAGHVTEMSNCKDDELIALLRGARALLFPSFVEGFGVPLVESLVLGTPVIASNLPVFREIAGDAPAFADPTDIAAWEAAVLRHLADGVGERARLAAFGYRGPDWGSYFVNLDAWLRRQ